MTSQQAACVVPSEKLQAALQFNKKVESRIGPEKFEAFRKTMEEYQPKLPPQADWKEWEDIYNQMKDNPAVKDQMLQKLSGSQQIDGTTDGNGEKDRTAMYDSLKDMLKDEPDLLQELEQFVSPACD